jgi:protein subunit release factor B
MLEIVKWDIRIKKEQKRREKRERVIEKRNEKKNEWMKKRRTYNLQKKKIMGYCLM